MTRSSARRKSAQTIKVYNSTDGPLAYDAEGRIIAARETAEVPAVVLVTDDEGKVTDTPQAVDVDPIKGHVDAGRFVLIEDDDAATDEPVAGNADDQTQEA